MLIPKQEHSTERTQPSSHVDSHLPSPFLVLEEKGGGDANDNTVHRTTVVTHMQKHKCLEIDRLDQ